jgi:(p)ppGpp synthase/HD superfamily hydrolase
MINSKVQSSYQKAILFAAKKHADVGQTIPGTDIPYVVHLSNVAMEILMAARYTEHFDLEFAVQVALLHDTLEDTITTFEEITANFGMNIAKAVEALTKNDEIPVSEKMQDSLTRILLLPKEVWAVKLADRITNLQKPPAHWDDSKIQKYHHEANTILGYLKGGNEYLESRLRQKIQQYESYFN